MAYFAPTLNAANPQKVAKSKAKVALASKMTPSLQVGDFHALKKEGQKWSQNNLQQKINRDNDDVD